MLLGLLLLLGAAATAPGWLQQRRRLVRLWIVRHGEAEHNIDKVNGWKIRDPHLTAKGWSQARAAAAAMPPGGFDVVISSPLRRCIETAVGLLRGDEHEDANGSGGSCSGAFLPMVLNPDLQEVFLGPADTGQAAKELVAEFAHLGFSSTQQLGENNRRRLPSNVVMNSTLLESTAVKLEGRDGLGYMPWYRAKEMLTGKDSCHDPAGRAAFGRAQALRLLEWLGSSVASPQALLGARWDSGAATAAGDRRDEELRILMVGHRGAFEAFGATLPPPLTGYSVVRSSHAMVLLL